MDILLTVVVCVIPDAATRLAIEDGWLDARTFGDGDIIGYEGH